MIQLLLVLGCHPDDGETVTAPPDTDADADADSDTDADTDTDTPPTAVAGLTSVTASLNPAYPTVVNVSWNQSQPAVVHAEYTFDDGIWLASPERDLVPGAHAEILLGIPYATEVVWRIVAEMDRPPGSAGADAAGITTTPDATITTGDVPDSMSVGDVTIADPSAWDPATPYVFASVSVEGSFSGQYWTMVVDRQGRAVWGHESPNGRASMHPRISWNEDTFLVDHNSYWGDFDGGVNSTVLALKIDGTLVKTWETPGLHHPFTDLPDGSLAYGRIYDRYSEALTVIDPSGTATDLFSCPEFLDDIGESAICASNTLWYDDTRDVFLFSMWTLETIIEVDGTTGNANRWFGHVNGAWDFSPPSSAFWYQHGGHYLPNGNLLTSSYVDDGEDAIVAREYEVDEQNEQLVEVWNFGIGDDIHGNDMGEVHRLPNGNTLSNYGTAGRLRESTPDGTVVWDLSWDGRTVGRSTPITGSLYDFAPEMP